MYRVSKQINCGSVPLSPFPFMTEAQMEGYILLNENVLQLGAPYDEPTIIGSQLSIPQAKVHGKNGRLDILVAYHDEKYAIVELKKGTIDDNTSDQLAQYLEYAHQSDDVIKAIAEYKNIDKSEVAISQDNFIGIMVGADVDIDLVEQMLNNGGNITLPVTVTKDLPAFGLTLNLYQTDGVLGLSAKEMFSFVNIVFRHQNGSKKKFTFGGKKYKAGALMKAVIEDYVKRNPKCTTDDVVNDLEIRKTGVFYTNVPNDTKRIFNTGKFGTSKYYTIRINGSDLYLSNQWSYPKVSNYNPGLTKLLAASDRLARQGRLCSAVL